MPVRIFCKKCKKLLTTVNYVVDFEDIVVAIKNIKKCPYCGHELELKINAREIRVSSKK